jgi:hypothetical protein
MQQFKEQDKTPSIKECKNLIGQVVMKWLVRS